jgi:hypothetical protein
MTLNKLDDEAQHPSKDIESQDDKNHRPEFEEKD